MRTRRKCRGSCGGSTKVVSAKLNSRASACIAPSASPRASGNTASWFPPNACSVRSEEHTSELQSHSELVCRLRLEKKKQPTCSIGAAFSIPARPCSPGRRRCCTSFLKQGAAAPFFFFNDTATTEIYTLSLHDALPISTTCQRARSAAGTARHARTSSRVTRSEEHTSELQPHSDLVCRLLLEKKKKIQDHTSTDEKQIHNKPERIQNNTT